jgi:hypothetical protein
MSEQRDNNATVLFIMLLMLAIATIAGLSTAESEVRDLQRRVGQLEQERR